MNDFITADSLEFEWLSPDAITLDAERVNHALELSQRSPNQENCWQIYLTALALVGFEQWIQQRDSDLFLQTNHCTILSLPFADATTAACNLQINGFRLCIVGTESLFDGTIAIPQAAIDSPDAVAHFYVPVEVYEEQGQILIRGFLRYDQLRQHQTTPLELAQDGTYRLPLDWFESDLNRLLLHLSCLEPSAIPLPTPLNAAAAQLDQILVQPAVKLRRWLRQQWDEATQGSWMLLPPIELAGAMREAAGTAKLSPANAFATILSALERSGRTVPTNAQGIYRDWVMANYPLRLYVATAAITAEQASEWSLLLILTTQDQSNLPSGICLQVSDGSALIGEQVLTNSTTADYLHLTAIGGLEEQFVVTIALADGTSLTLPPFGY